METKGYKKYYERPACWNCIYYETNILKVPLQDVKRLCTKITPTFEVDENDICDEYELEILSHE